MRKPTLPLIALAALAGLAVAAVSSASIQRRGDTDAPQLRLSPVVILRGHNATITVTHTNVSSLEVRVVGATTNFGQPLPWTPLRYKRGVWYGLLPAPELRGIYPLELRSRRGSPVLRSERWLLRVFARGTLSRPSFGTPEGVARAWVQALPLDARLVAMRRWRLSDGDLRDPRRHQRLVVAYTLAGHRTVADRLGMFVTAVRDALRGPWRLLEATVVP